jgi:thymidylate kinase
MTPVIAESAAHATQLSFRDFAGQLFGKLASLRVRYCVLHSYENLPETPASDLDIAVAEGELSRLPEIFAALDARGYRAVQYLNYAVGGHYFVFSWTTGSTLHTAAVDFISEHREGKLILTSGDELVRGRRPFRDFWIPAPAAEYRYLLAKKVLKGKLPTSQALRLAELAIELGPGEARVVCERLFGPSCGARAAEASLAGTVTGELLGQLKWRLWMRILARQPWTPVWYQITDLPRKAVRLTHPSGFLVAVLGPDGAGKSTLIEKAGEQLDCVFRSRHVFHWRPKLLFPDRSGPVSNPHGRSRFSTPRSLAHLAGHFADYHLGFALRIWPLLARSGLVLFDRYFYDLSADPKRYRYGGPARIPEILSNIVPRPGLMLVLDAPEETLLNRKQETTADELEMERACYGRLADRGLARRIDASRPPEVVALEACHAVLEALRSRFASRHGRWLMPSVASEVEQAVSILSGCTNGHGAGEERRLAVLPAAAPRWIVPLKAGWQTSGRLSVYVPYTLKARLLKAGLSAAMRTPSSVWVRSMVSLPAKGPLDALVRQVWGESSADFTISLGTPGRYRKATIQITAGGRICGFLKVPLAPEAGDRVKQEAAALARLSAVARLRAVLPAVLFAGEWNGRFVLLEAPLGGKRGGVRLERKHRVFLDELAKVEPVPRQAGTLLEEVGREWELVASELDAAGRLAVAGALRRIERDYSTLTIRCGFSHGDFAPWNTRRGEDCLEVFDWEAAEPRKPLDWDAFHFQTQTASLLRRDAGYRIEGRVPESHCSYLLYLVHSTCTLLTEQGTGGKGLEYRLRRLREELRRGEGAQP